MTQINRQILTELQELLIYPILLTYKIPIDQLQHLLYLNQTFHPYVASPPFFNSFLKNL